MAAAYKVWKVSYRYRVSHIDGDDDLRDSYVVIASSEAEAFQKADACFSYSELNKDLLANGEATGKTTEEVTVSNLRRTASEFQERFALPQFSLESDAEQFTIRPKIKKDGKSLEFIVGRK